MTGKVRCKVSCNADGAYSGTTAAVRHCKGLVKVEVTYISTDKTGVGDTYLTIHVGTVHVYLTTVFVDNLADFSDLYFKHTVS